MTKFIVLSLLLVYTISCKKDDKNVQSITIKEKTTPKKKKLIKKIVLKKDSLNSKNVEIFFTAYGKQNLETIVEFETRLGNFTVKLYKDTPVDRANFIFLAKKGYFNTTCFHRLVPGFVAQFGDSDRLETVKFRNKYQNYKLRPEFRKNHSHKRGALAIARDWENNPKKIATPFEFYIVQNKKGEHHLNFEHTVLGEVINGMNIIDKIMLEKTDKDEWPFKDIDLKVINIK